MIDILERDFLKSKEKKKQRGKEIGGKKEFKTCFHSSLIFHLAFYFSFLLQTLTHSGEVCIWCMEDGACVSRIYLKTSVSVPYKWTSKKNIDF